jgi:hypothetical protein
MSTPEIPLHEAAGAIGQMSSTHVQRALRDVKERPSETQGKSEPPSCASRPGGVYSYLAPQL